MNEQDPPAAPPAAGHVQSGNTPGSKNVWGWIHWYARHAVDDYRPQIG
jgi:hypothetical protein